MQADMCAHLLSERHIRVRTAHGHPARDGAGVRLQDEPAASNTLGHPGYTEEQATRNDIVIRSAHTESTLKAHPPSTVSSMASSTRSRFSSTVFFSTAPLDTCKSA